MALLNWQDGDKKLTATTVNNPNIAIPDNSELLKLIQFDHYDELKDLFAKGQVWGLSIGMDLYDCNPDYLRSAPMIEQYVINLCELIEVKRFGEPTIVNFGEDERVAGYSMTQLIETSLVSGHFVNLTNHIYMDIFSCKVYNPNVAAKYTMDFFQAKSSSLHVAFRK